jgi:hypothetical protein
MTLPRSGQSTTQSALSVVEGMFGPLGEEAAMSEPRWKLFAAQFRECK